MLIVLVAFLTWIISKRKKSEEDIFSPLDGTKYQSMKPLIEAQAKHETGKYTSRAFIENNNLFGMKNAYKRQQLGINKRGDQYRLYSDPTESVKDLLLYFDYVNFPVVTDAATYAKELKNRSYYEDSIRNYYEGLRANA